MIDLLSAGIGATIAFVSWTVGRASKRKAEDPTPKTICSCTHGYGSHEQGKRCAAQIERPHYYDNGSRNGYEWVCCPCLSYDGPEPLPRVWTEGIG